MPRVSIRESTAPTSWKWTEFIVLPWVLDSATARREKARIEVDFTQEGRGELFIRLVMEGRFRRSLS